MSKIVKIQDIDIVKIAEKFKIEKHFIEFLLKKKIIKLPISKNDEIFLNYLSKFLLDRDFVSMQIETINERDFLSILNEMYRDNTSYLNSVILKNLEQRLLKNNRDEYDR